MKYSTSLKLNHIFRRLYHTSGVADGLLVLYARKNPTCATAPAAASGRSTA